jgi:hypothetical protein
MLGTMPILGRQLYGDQVPNDAAEGPRWLRTATAVGTGQISSPWIEWLAKNH